MTMENPKEISNQCLNELCNILANKEVVPIATWDSGGDSASIYFEDGISEELQDWLSDLIESETDILQGNGGFSSVGTITKPANEHHLWFDGSCTYYEDSDRMAEETFDCSIKMDICGGEAYADYGHVPSSKSNDKDLMEFLEHEICPEVDFECLDNAGRSSLLEAFRKALSWSEDADIEWDQLSLSLDVDADGNVSFTCTLDAYQVNDESRSLEVMEHLTGDSLVLLAIRNKIGLPLLTEEELENDA